MRRLGEGEAREGWVREWRTSPLSELLETSPRDIGWRGGGWRGRGYSQYTKHIDEAHY